MKMLIDRSGRLARGLADIRTQFGVPKTFPDDACAQADLAAARPVTGHDDRTDLPFVTLDPAASTDLDQAFAIEQTGSDLLLHYAIADTAWFVHTNDPLDREAWNRGATIYMADGKARLYPGLLSEGAASLLPNVERPAIIFTVKLDLAGKPSLESATRALIRSRAKLAYETVRSTDLPSGFAEFSKRIEHAEDERGAARVDAPEQELAIDADGRFALQFRPQLRSETENAGLSLAANLAIADALLAHGTGLFRVMPEPDQGAVNRLRHSAKALGLIWPKALSLKDFERSLDSANPREAAFQTEIRRAGPKASYAPYRPGVVPWHSAMAATYAHATAPLRRLADRYVIEAALQVASGRPVSDELEGAFQRLPAVMARAEERAGQIERAVLDLAEAVILEGREGSRFKAVVTDLDDRGARIQLSEPAVVTRIDGKGAMPGDTIVVELLKVDVAHRQVTFQRAD